MKRRQGEKLKAAKDAAAAEEALTFFLDSIDDPHNPRHCGRCLYGAILAFTKNSSQNPTDTPYKLSSTLVKNLDFWNTFYGFLVIKRTDKQMNRLLTQLSQCSCQLTDRRIHQYHEDAKKAEQGSMQRTHMLHFAPPEKKHLYTLERCAVIVKIFCVIFACLLGSGVKSVAKGLPNTWPNLPMDLMPFGPDSLVQTLLQWHRFVPDPIIFSLAGRILRVARFLIVPSLTQYKFSNYVVETTRQIIDETIIDMTKIPVTELPSRLPTMFRYQYTVIGFDEYLNVILNMPQEFRVDLMTQCETKLMQLCSIMLYLSADPDMQLANAQPEAMGHFVLGAEQLFRFYHMHLYPRPDIPLYPKIVELDNRSFPPPAFIREVPYVAVSFISSFHSDTMCSAHKCKNSIQSAGKNFQRCSRCNVVPYCSRDCQIKAWREEKYPHKRICPILRLLMETAGGQAMFFPVPDTPAHLVGIEHHELIPVIIEAWQQAGFTAGNEDLIYLRDWGRMIDKSRALPDGSQWTPGFDDYDELIAKLSAPGRGPKPKYMNRLARWPSEVAKERELLEIQPFWLAEEE